MLDSSWILTAVADVSTEGIGVTTLDPREGSLGSRDPLQKYIREAKRMVYWYKNTKKYYFLTF